MVGTLQQQVGAELHTLSRYVEGSYTSEAIRETLTATRERLAKYRAAWGLGA